MTINMKRFVGICIICLYGCLGFSQNQTFETWVELAVSKEISHNLSLGVVEETRFQQNGYLLKLFSGEFGLDYKIAKPLSVGITYKCSQKNKEQGFFATNTYSVNASYKEKFGPFKLAYRNKFESSKETFINEYSDLFYSYTDRNKLKLTYSKKSANIEPSVSIETFHPINNLTSYGVSEIRYGGGVWFDLPKKFELELGVIYKKLYHVKIPEATTILAISISKEL